jgi:enamine deaminase RidA (YjgF/YER057c/UK114 family)
VPSAPQTEQVARNLETALRAVGADFDQLVKWTISVSTASR